MKWQPLPASALLDGLKVAQGRGDPLYLSFVSFQPAVIVAPRSMYFPARDWARMADARVIEFPPLDDHVLLVGDVEFGAAVDALIAAREGYSLTLPVATGP